MLHHDRAETQDRVERDHVLGAVREHQRDPVTPADPAPAQSLGGPAHLVAELGVGGGRAEEVERDQFAEAPDRPVQQVDQRLLGDLDVQGYAGGVAARPGALVLCHGSLRSPLA